MPSLSNMFPLPNYRWRGAKDSRTRSARVKVRIEAEAPVAAANEGFATNDPAFGIWRDHRDATDVAAYVRAPRAPRYGHDGSPG